MRFAAWSARPQVRALHCTLRTRNGLALRKVGTRSALDGAAPKIETEVDFGSTRKGEAS